MKKLLLLAALMSFSNLFSQSLEKGSIIIEPYVGFPNFSKLVLKNIDLVYDAKLSSSGPFGLKGDYFLSEKLSVGANFIYNSYNISGKVDSLTNQNIDSTYSIDLNMKRFRFQVNAKYHFYTSDKIDSYVGFGLGSNTRKYSIETSYPNFDKAKVFGTLIPISARFEFGTSFFLSKNIGLNLEVGIGGPLFLTGIFVKI